MQYLNTNNSANKRAGDAGLRPTLGQVGKTRGYLQRDSQSHRMLDLNETSGIILHLTSGEITKSQLSSAVPPVRQ